MLKRIMYWLTRPFKQTRTSYWPSAIKTMAKNVTLSQLKNPKLFRKIGKRQFARICAMALKRIYPEYTNNQRYIIFKQILRITNRK